MASWANKFRTPLFTEMMRSRTMAITIAGFGAAQLVISAFTPFGLPCAFHETLHLPCPGCGLTRSVLAIFRGQFGYSFSLHPFGYLLLLGLIMCLAASILPDKWRLPTIERFEKIETHTGITMILLVMLMLTWAARLTGVLPLAQV